MRNRIQRAVMMGLLIAAGVGTGACLSPPGRACGDEWCPEGYLCSPVSAQQSTCLAPDVCGNSIQDVGEQCDDGNLVDGDGCDHNCTLTRCGNGIVSVGEVCDDGNLTSGDDCSICKLELAEVEPNEDGTPSMGGSAMGNDFSAVNANGPFTDFVAILASISPSGDEDVFKFINQGPVSIRMKFQTWSRALGIGVTCWNDIDTVLYVRDAKGTVLAENDDRYYADPCSTVYVEVPAGETVYVHVLEASDENEISAYILMADYSPWRGRALESRGSPGTRRVSSRRRAEDDDALEHGYHPHRRR